MIKLQFLVIVGVNETNWNFLLSICY